MADLEKMGAREWLIENGWGRRGKMEDDDTFEMRGHELIEIAQTYADYVLIQVAKDKANELRRLGSAGQGEPEPIKALQDMRPQSREYNMIPRDEGPWSVTLDATTCPPYTYAVVGSKGMKVAFAVTEKTAQSYADQMNEKGYIENPD